MRVIRRKGKCICKHTNGVRTITCVSCSTLALKILKIVLDIPEGVWYSVSSLGGDAGLKVVTMRQLEFSWGASTSLRSTEGASEESDSDPERW